MSKKTSEQAARELVDSYNREVASGGSGEKTKELAREIGGEKTREDERVAQRRRRSTTVRQPTPKAEPESVPQTQDVSKQQSTSPKEEVSSVSKTQSNGDSKVISGVIAEDTERSRLARIRSERARQEAKGTFRGDVASGFGAVKEVAIETGLAVGRVARGAVRFTGFERKGGVAGFFPSPVPKTTPINVPTLQDVEGAGASLGAELKRDPIKGGVLIAAEIATLGTLRGPRGAVSVASNVPSPLSSNIPSTGKPFKIADDVGVTVMQLDKRSGSGSIVSTGGQLDLTGGLAKTPESVFRRGDFIPVQTSPGGKLDFLPPNDPRLRSEAFSPLRSPSQSRLTDPKVSGVGDPVLVTDKFTGKTTTVEASAVPDFLSESPGRFTDVRRPSSVGLTLDPSIKPISQRQTQLSPDSPSQPFFAFLVPVPVGRFSPTSTTGFSSGKSSFMDVADVGKGVVSPSKPSSLVKPVSAPSFSTSGVPSLGTQTVSDLKPVSLTSSVTNQKLVTETKQEPASASITSTTTSVVTTPKLTSISKTAVRTRSASRSTTSLVTQPKTGLASVTFTPVSPTTTTPTPNRTVRTPGFRPTGFPRFDINRQSRTTVKTSFSTSRTPGFRSIRTAGAGRDFIISPGRTNAGKVVELRKGVKGEGPRRKKKKETSFSSSTSISFKGLGI